MNIKRVKEEDSRIGDFLNDEFLSYAKQNSVDLNYYEFVLNKENITQFIEGSEN